ncbi:UNVERIFIED_CONTAM: hypothetical protein RMT77_016504 [Armadillidium vulgare]
MEEAQGTIKPKEDFNAEWAAERFKKSMRGIGTDEKMIIKMLITHDSLQREEIERKYKAMYGEELVDDLKAELGGHFENAVVAMLTSKYDVLVNSIEESFRLVGSDAQTLTEILCCRDAESIKSLSWWYENNFGLSLEDAIDLNLSSDFRRLISSLACCDRDPEENEVDEEIVKDDAQKLYDAGIGKNFGTDEDVFVHILNNRSYSHLLRLFDVYEDFSGEPIETSIDSEFSGDVKEGLLSIVKRVRDPSGFFAERLNMSMRGSGTDDKTLIRIIVTRSEEDLENIKQRYMEMYGSSLVKDIKSDTGGDYQKLLCAILTANEEESA